jgi:hypothetical protein
MAGDESNRSFRLRTSSLHESFAQLAFLILLFAIFAPDGTTMAARVVIAAPATAFLLHWTWTELRLLHQRRS